MQSFIRKLLTEWRRLELPFAGETFVVAVSGGGDSVSLLLALHELKRLKKLDLRFVVAHFNHNLRGAASDTDELFVKNLAARFNFELALAKSENAAASSGNLEQNARHSRYAFLSDTAKNLDAFAVLTAHTLNDQAETFLFNLLRGSGIEGLSGMKSCRNLDFDSPTDEPNPAIKLLRPFLNWAKREDTENFCLLNEIEFRHDAMNEDLKFNRVRIRKILLPMLQDFNPKIIETLAQTAGLLRESAELLAETAKHRNSEAGNRQPKAEHGAEVLLLKDLRDVFPQILRTILRDWLKNNRGNLRGLELKHIQAVEKLIFSRRSGRVVELPNSEKIIKTAGKLVFQKT